ncbi:MAG TPA: 3-deoxy-manno-octulosonate cytidylyltransferase [Polyangiaceae bacterium]|nr:3-deoxy-manno-octulosonate cytidylyltransferase [Polyangiaceae bacterium]
MPRTAAIAIPARLESSRYPNKVLAEWVGRPILWHVWQNAIDSRVGSVTVLTDAPQLCSLVESWGGSALLSDNRCTSGTERIASALDRLDGDFLINVQADLPTLAPQAIARIAALGLSGSLLATAAYRIQQREELLDPNVVKVVRARAGQAIYFSRNPVPYVPPASLDEWFNREVFWGHVGVYGYQREMLELHRHWPRSTLEEAEDLEQLRFVDAGHWFDVIELESPLVSINVPKDLMRLEADCKHGLRR